ncbi:MAG TPA: hypothetical protein VNO17_05005 [Actinomycetota bacterium]|nr:hypothetical protein [Actinomycetota bacterium]
MTAPPAGAGPEPVRIVIVRAWLEPGHPTPLRVRVLRGDPTGGERPRGDPGGSEVVAVAATIDDAVRAVRAALEEMVRGPGRVP